MTLYHLVDCDAYTQFNEKMHGTILTKTEKTGTKKHCSKNDIDNMTMK